jgi:hypothetical protein
MTNDTNNTDTQERQDDFRPSTTAAERQQISRIADEAARRGKDRQQRYDDGHTIFTK